MNEGLIKKLEQFGLTQKESAVYTATLIGGEMTAEEIAKQAKQNRSTAYVQLRSLIEAGLVTNFKRGKKTFFAAESPQNLERIIDKRSQEIEEQKATVLQLVPELLRIFRSAGSRPVVRIFEGKEGLHSMRLDILNQKPCDIKIITSIDQMREIFSANEMAKFSTIREGLKIKSYVLYSNETGETFKPFKYQELKRISKDQLNFGADMYVYGDSVSFATTYQSVVGVTIINKDVANTIRAIFDMYWRAL